MNSSLTAEHRPKTICVQPDCLFKGAGFKAQHLAALLIRTLAREALAEIVYECEQIESRSQCIACALRIMQGRKAFRTEEEWKLLDDLGHWHRRRQRRNKH